MKRTSIELTDERFDPVFAGWLATVLVAAIAEAKALIDAGEFGDELREVVRHAREMHELLREQVSAAPPGSGERFDTICDTLGANIAWLEELAQDDIRPSTLH
ncbi:MAG: hypothetical protein ABI624_19860 [Casimicrobiaceae bacterium]